MYHSPTQTDFNLITQQSKDVYVQINLLNKQYKVLDHLDGNLLSDNYNVDSQSRQRRTYSCELHVSDPSFLLGDDKKIWIDKYIQVFYGIKDIHSGEVRYWLLGTFSYQSIDYTYDATNRTLSLSCVDLMADYDGTKNGQISGYSMTIPAGEDIRKSVIGVLKSAGIEKYYVEDIKKEIPYDLEFNGTITYCDVLDEICNLYDSWEFYFDVDGTFVWRKIPTGISEPVIFNDVFLDKIWISENTSAAFDGIYNVTEVWGKVLELENNDRYAETSTMSGDTYSITLKDADKLEDIDHLDQIGIKICATNVDNAKVSINGNAAIPIVNDDGTPIKAGRMKADTTYVFSYRRNMGENIQNCLYLLGQYQCYGIYKETNKDCPFSTTNLGYEIINRVDYENLYSDDLCYNQAEYLTYQTTALLDTINLNLLIIPWIDVNSKVEYTSKNSGIKNQYIIKNFGWSTFDGTMSMTLYKFQESFSYVKKNAAKMRHRTEVK